MSRYTVIIASRVDSQLIRHIRFLSNVSLPAAKRFRKEYSETLDHLEENPFQFPADTDPNLPEDMYRKALIARCCKAMFMVENKNVYLDAVVDCRRSAAAYDL